MGLRYATLRAIAHDYATLRVPTLRYARLRYARLRYVARGYATLRAITICYARLRYATLRATTLGRDATWVFAARVYATRDYATRDFGALYALRYARLCGTMAHGEDATWACTRRRPRRAAGPCRVPWRCAAEEHTMDTQRWTVDMVLDKPIQAKDGGVALASVTTPVMDILDILDNPHGSLNSWRNRTPPPATIPGQVRHVACCVQNVQKVQRCEEHSGQCGVRRTLALGVSMVNVQGT